MWQFRTLQYNCLLLEIYPTFTLQIFSAIKCIASPKAICICLPVQLGMSASSFAEMSAKSLMSQPVYFWNGIHEIA